jgi:hypothetical protein
MNDGKTLVVNFFAGSGAGKSTLTSGVFSELKWNGINTEIAPEFAKDLVWEKRFDTFKDQIYIFGKQYHRINRLNGQVEVILTDSPLLISYMYAPDTYPPSFFNLVIDMHNTFDNLNYYVVRKKDYNPIGRLQNEEEAIELDRKMKAVLDYYAKVEYTEIIGEKASVPIITEQILKRIGKI